MKKSSSPLNAIWLFMIVSATVVAAYNGNMAALTEASFTAAESAVTLAIGLIGAMALWLGIMKVAETAGMMRFSGFHHARFNGNHLLYHGRLFW